MQSIHLWPPTDGLCKPQEGVHNNIKHPVGLGLAGRQLSMGGNLYLCQNIAGEEQALQCSQTVTWDELWGQELWNITIPVLGRDKLWGVRVWQVDMLSLKERPHIYLCQYFGVGEQTWTVLSTAGFLYSDKRWNSGYIKALPVLGRDKKWWGKGLAGRHAFNEGESSYLC
jgi:hypothetical protein